MHSTKTAPTHFTRSVARLTAVSGASHILESTMDTMTPVRPAAPVVSWLTYTVSSGEGTKARELIISNHEAPAGLL